MAEQEKPLSKVLKRPGIPVLARPRLSYHAVIMWCIAVFVVFSLPGLLVGTIFYSQTDLPLGGMEHLDLAINVEGCDVLFESAHAHHFELRLGYWRFMGSGNVTVVNNTVNVEAIMSRKALSFHCLLIVQVPRKSKGPHFRSVNLTIEPSAYALTFPQPSNVAEMISLDMDGVRVKDSLHLNVTTMCATTLHDTVAGAIDVNIQGGSLTITDGEDAGAGEAGLMSITADNAMVMIRTQSNDLHVALDNVTAPAAALSGAAVTSLSGKDGGLEHYHLAKGMGTDATPVDVRIHATESAVYALAADAGMIAQGDGSCPELETHRGALAAGPPKLMTGGVEVMQELTKWLKSPTNAVEFVVYIHVPAPQDEYNGMLKLVSTEIYTALSPIGFALLSGGAMEPYVVRIAMPVVGMPWSFPGHVCQPWRNYEAMRYGSDLLDAVDKVMSTPALGLNSSKWVWEDPGQTTYIFDHVPAKNGRSAHWRKRPLSAFSSFTFRAASAITLLVGIMAGAAICKILWMTVRPLTMDTIRTADVFASASYRLQHTNEATQWVVASTYVQWPMGGILLRWSKRPMATKFATFTFVARPWPKKEGDGEITCSGIDATRLPSYPSLPDQECFLFVPRPGDKKHPTPWHPEKFDTELYATGMLQFARNQPHMTIGFPYQLQVVAKDAAGKVVEKSVWSRPVTVQPPRAFTEFPLLLWRGCCGRIPDNTLQTFVNEHCLDIEVSPTLVLSLSNFQLTADSDSTLFLGEDIGAYGAEEGALLHESPAQQVVIQASAGGLQELYECTGEVPLPTQEEKAEKKGLVQPFSQAMPNKPKGFAPGLEKSKVVVLNFNKDDTLNLPVTYDKTVMITIEAAIQTESGQRPNTAKVEMSWQQLLDLVTRSSLEQRQSKVQRTQSLDKSKSKAGTMENMATTQCDILLRDGLTPVAVLSFQCNFTNSFLDNLAPPAKPPGSTGAPDIFRTVLPGATFVWGETTYLAWECSKVDKRVGQGVTFDMVLVAESCDVPKGQASKASKVKTETVIATGINAFKEKEAITLAPNMPMTCQFMRCHLEARASRAVPPGSTASGPTKGTVLASSWEFLITRPVTMQQLELAYASFCIRNHIPMHAVPLSAMKDLMVETAERRLYYCTGYRAPLPLPAEVSEEDFGPNKGPLVVENPSSIVITDANGLTLPVQAPAPHPQSAKPSDPESAGGGAQASSASPQSGAAAGSGGLQEPLLSAGSSSAVSKQASQGSPAGSPASRSQPVKSKDVLAKLDTVVLTTNVFWKWNQECTPHLFLKYWFMPKFAEPNYLAASFEYWGWDRVAEFISGLDFIDLFFRYVLGTVLYYVQMGAIGFPGLLLFMIWLWHDSVLSKMSPDLMPSQDAHRIFLVDFIIAPSFSRWYHIQWSAKLVYATLILYVLTVVLMAFYCNFVHPFIRFGHQHFFTFMNNVVCGMWAMSFFLSIVLVTVVLTWIIMGALVNPAILLPYAVMVLALGALYTTLHGKMSEMHQHASKGIMATLENILQAIFEVFIDDPGSDAKLEEFRSFLQTLSVSTVENMEQVERDVRGKLLKQSKITTEVGGALRTQIQTLRSSAYYTTPEGKAKDKVLLTDFVPGSKTTKDAIIQKAQEVALEEATIEGTNMLGTSQTTTAKAADGTDVTTTSAAVAPPIGPVSLGKAVANFQGMPMEKPGKLSSSAMSVVPKLTSQLSLKPATAMAALNGYVLQLQLARAKCRPKNLENALSVASLFSRIRHDRLFSHFLPQEEKQLDGSMKTTCNARKMLEDLQKLEMENLSIKAAAVLTEQIDWTRIGRDAETYVISTLYEHIVTRAVNEQLSPVISGSAAFDLTMQASDLAFVKTEAVYKLDPLQIFVDCGIIELRYKRLPETQRVLTDLVDSMRAFDNSLGPDCLINAVKALCLPDLQPAAVNDIPGRSFLWFGALVRILKRLGWTQEEMPAEWLSRRWRAVTNGTGLFGYEDPTEVNDLITSLSGEGLWKAAAKGLMLEVGTGGFLGCDVARDGVEKAAKAAHHLAEDIDRMDLKAVLEAAGDWPDWLEDIWRQNAQQAGSVDPLFLPGPKIMDFLQDLTYMPASPTGMTFTQLSPYATDVDDLVWVMGSDDAVWHTLGATKRRMRGLGLEVSLKLFDALDSVPTDLDIYFKALHWQQTKLKKQAASVLRLDAFGSWLSDVYFKDQTWCTFCQFKAIIQTSLQCDIPEGPLKEQIFDPCPTDPEDDLGELRRLDDLGAALQIWLGYGLWPKAVGQAVEELLPRGRVLTVAKTILQEEFEKLDTEGVGVLQPGQAVLLMHRLMVPGLTCEDMKAFIDEQLNCAVPEAVVHKYFVMMDVNGDGVLSAQEFIPMFVYFAFDFFPQHVLWKLGLGPGNIAIFIAGVLSLLSLIFALVSLVISAFPTGRSISSSIHTIVSGTSAWATKQSSDKSIGFEDTMSNLKKQLETKALEAMVTVLGVSKAVIEKVASMTSNII